MKKLSVLFLIIFFLGLAAYLWTNSPFKGAVVRQTGGKAASNYSLVNINTAGEEELDTLPSVGKVTAGNIIEYRKEHGKFSGIEKVKNVKGIGEKTFLKLKERISAE